MGNAQFELATVDYIIVAVYFVAVLFHGWWVGRGEETSKDYFLAGGKLPWRLIGFSLLASQMSGSSFVGLMGGAYAEGMTMFNYEWTAVIVLLFFAVFMLPTFLKAGLYTIPEYLENRYSPNARRAFSLFTLLAIMFIDSAGALYAGGLVITCVIPVALWQAIAVLALAVFLIGLFWRGASAPGALVGIGVGIFLGIPLFITKEVTDVWVNAGLPEIHFTYMAVVMFVLGGSLLALTSVATQQPDKEQIETATISWENIKEHLGSEGKPLWADFRVGRADRHHGHPRRLVLALT